MFFNAQPLGLKYQRKGRSHGSGGGDSNLNLWKHWYHGQEAEKPVPQQQDGLLEGRAMYTVAGGTPQASDAGLWRLGMWSLRGSFGSASDSGLTSGFSCVGVLWGYCGGCPPCRGNCIKR